IVDNDGGVLAQRLIDELADDPLVWLEITDETDAERKVSVGVYDGAFILAPDFTQKLSEGEFYDLVRMIAPLSVTGAGPLSETISAAVVDIWLEQVTTATLTEKLVQLPQEEVLTVRELIERVQEEYPYEDIIALEKTEVTSAVPDKQNTVELSPFDYAIFIFALFAYFTVAFSSEWALSVTTLPMKERIKAHRSQVITISTASQLANVVVCLLFYLLMCVGYYFVLGGIAWQLVLKGALLMAIYLVVVNSMALIVTQLVSNLMQMIVAQTMVGVLQMLLMSTLLFNTQVTALLERIMQVFPGYHLMTILKEQKSWKGFLVMAAAWMAVSVLLSGITNRDTNTGALHWMGKA
ncbi:MAG: ABC transporter permease, partial [Eubacteriales bacterium]